MAQPDLILTLKFKIQPIKSKNLILKIQDIEMISYFYENHPHHLFNKK